jgi:hypothetical protein
VRTPPPAAIFSDGFESGNLSNWDTVSGLTVESTDKYDGTYAAESIGDGTSVAYAWKTLPSIQPNLYYDLHFEIVSQGANTVYLERFRTATGALSGSATSIIGVFVSTTGKLGIRDDQSNTFTSTTPVTSGTWHELQGHVNVTTGQVEVWLDGTLVSTLSTTLDLGPDPVGIIQLGANATAKTYDVRYDDVAVDTVQLP